MKTVTDLREIQLRLLDILTDVDRYCRAEGLRYSIAYGTLLGAVRHSGFIPWDDDIDIIMPRPDFEYFVANYGKDGSTPYRCLYDTRTPEEYFVQFFAKVHDPRTVSVEARMPRYRFGLNIDIFPVDGKPETDQLRFEKECCSLVHRIYLSQRPFFPWSWHDPLLPKIEAHVRGLDWWMRKCTEKMKSHPFDGSRFRGAVSTRPSGLKEVFPAEMFDAFRDISFEGREFMCVADTEGWLTHVFGPDFMTPPPAHLRKTHNLTVTLKD